MAKNRSEARSADDQVHEHQTRLVAYNSSLEKKRIELEARNSGEDPQEVLAQKRLELEETVNALDRQDEEASQLRQVRKGLRDQIEKAQTALDKHDEKEVSAWRWIAIRAVCEMKLLYACQIACV